MKKLFVVLFILAVAGVFAQQPVVAVAPFDAISGISATDASIITRVFFIRLGNTKKVTLVDRNIVDRILREHNFQAGDWSNQQKTAELGKAFNADWIVRGELEKFGNNILVTVQFYDIQTFQFMGGSDVLIANAAAAYDNMDPLVNKLVETITNTGTRTQSDTTAAGFVRINGGTFTMGSSANEPERDGDETQHQVTISSFYIGKYEVTQKEWYDVMGMTVRQQRDKGDKSWSIYGEGDNYPMYYVSWYDAVEYCNARSRKEGLTPAYTIDKSRSDPNNTSEYDTVRWVVTWNRNANGYRLPTEAEWEYACRAGTRTPFNTGNNITTSLANYNGNYPYNNNAEGTYRTKTTTAGSFAPNPWGLYDMHGNVWEWCWDWYGNYSSSAQTDPMGASSGSDRVGRGGGWTNSAGGVRSADRDDGRPDIRHVVVGFRLARQ